MQSPGWFLLLAGVVIALIGLIWLLSPPSIPWLGRLPGDIVIDRGNFKFYFSIMTCILLSLVLTVVVWVVRYF